MRNLCIDIGNTRTKTALFDDGKLVAHWTARNGQDFLAAAKTAVREGRTEGSDYMTERPEVKKKESDDLLEKLDGAILCSTANISESTLEAFDNLPCPIRKVLTWQTPVPVENHYSTPQTLGMDRLSAVIGAYANHPGNDILVIDSGTAITYDFINAQGQYLGGNISPGVDLSFKALHALTARLPLVEEEGDRPPFGISTDTAIRCGVLDGVRHEIEGTIRSLIVKYPNLLVFLTGGHGFDFDVSLKKRIFADKLLVLKGLDCILRNLQAHPTHK